MKSGSRNRDRPGERGVGRRLQASATLVAALATVACAARHYVAADFSGDTVMPHQARALSLRTSEGRRIEAPTLPMQVAFADAKISDDGLRVGWLELEENCCTSYPIPMSLVIVRAGRIERRFSDLQSIGGWSFIDGGSAVAYWIAPLHGTDSKTLLLRDVASGRLLATWFVPDSGPNEITERRRADAIEHAPAWVRQAPDVDR